MKNNFEIVNDRKVDFYFDGFKDKYLRMEMLTERLFFVSKKEKHARNYSLQYAVSLAKEGDYFEKCYTNIESRNFLQNVCTN